MTKCIYVIRHCKAEGQEPVAKLTSLGLLQGEKLACLLKDKAIDYIISSPYKRAIDSILPLANEINVKVVSDERLKERVLSSINQPNWLNMLEQSFTDLHLSFAGGESSEIAMRRIADVVSDVLKNEYENTVLVSHGNLITLLLKFYDHSIGYNEWQALTNPDVYKLCFKTDSSPIIERIWTECCY